MWPTPRTSETAAKMTMENVRERVRKTGYHSNLEEAVAVTENSETEAAGGALNPTWVEWLMGFPLGWTVCDASGTRSSRRSSKSSGER
jgi:DNA (cytosine-5)-methyltransferase 1